MCSTLTRKMFASPYQLRKPATAADFAMLVLLTMMHAAFTLSV